VIDNTLKSQGYGKRGEPRRRHISAIKPQYRIYKRKHLSWQANSQHKR